MKKQSKGITLITLIITIVILLILAGICIQLITNTGIFENAKKAKAMGEKAKVSIRNIRKDANDEVKKLEKDKSISEDEAKKAYDEVQKITDNFIEKIDEAVKNKEEELLKV